MRSVWQLELILLLRASNRPLLISEIAQAMYMPAESLESVLDGFAKQGIVQVVENNPKSYLCLPKTVELREAIEETVRAYAERRPAVISLIFANPLEYFSDAFNLKAKED